MIQHLPDDMVRGICERLSGRDVARMACVSNHTNRLAKDVNPWLRKALKGTRRVSRTKRPHRMFEHKNSLNTNSDVEYWSNVCVETPSEGLHQSIKHQLKLREFLYQCPTNKRMSSMTPEQARVVSTPPNGQVMAIQAYAGTGKTTTLYRYAERWKSKRILYLAYNKALTDESKERFRGLPNVHVMTIHSMALQSFRTGEFELSKKIKPTDTLTQETIDEFERYCSTDRVRLPDTGHVRALWERMFETHDTPVTHDAYLKAFQRNKPTLDQYDIVMLDEVQDCTDCVLDIVLRQTHATRVLVGDAYQKIYGFRHVNEAFDYIQRTDRNALLFQLSVSFRMGFTLMSYVNVFLKRVYNANGFTSSKQSGDTKIRFFKRNQFRDIACVTRLPRGTVVLCRYNINLLKLMFVLCEHDLPFRVHGKSFDFEKEISIVTNLDFLVDGNVNAMTREKMRKFSTIEQLIEHYARQNNHEWRTRIRLYHQYGGEALVRMWRIAAAQQQSEEHGRDCLTLTTAHQSKGCEFDHVLLFDDFPMSNGDARNILYVAMTRAKKSVYLNESLSCFFKKAIKPIVYTDCFETSKQSKKCAYCHRTNTNRLVCRENDHEGIMEHNMCELYEYVPMCNLCVTSRPG